MYVMGFAKPVTSCINILVYNMNVVTMWLTISVSIMGRP